MTQRTLYAYAEGLDLWDVAEQIERRCDQFVREGTWKVGAPRFVNQRRENDPSLGPGERPDWDIGLNFDLPGESQAPDGWFDDVERIAVFLGELSEQAEKVFVVGVGDIERGYSEDLVRILGNPTNLDLLRRVIGPGGPKNQ
jgi:hypothetical protein